MINVMKICLNCRHFRLKDELAGVCRVDKRDSKDYPAKLNEESCGRWCDCGQQYFIRTGWIKNKAKQGKTTES